MTPFEPHLQGLASKLGIVFNADGFPVPLIRKTNDVGVMAVAMIIENSLRFEDVDERRQKLAEVTESIDQWSQILGANDQRIQILWAMHTVACAIIDGRQIPTVEELGLLY